MGYTAIHPNTSSIRIPTLPSSHSKHMFITNPPSNLTLPRAPLRRSFISLARRRSNSGRPSTPSVNKKSNSRKDSNKDDDLDEDAFEALFKQLEEDLKKDGQSDGDDDEDISEEELAMLEHELEEALAEDEDLSELLTMTKDDDIAAQQEVDGEEELVDEPVEDDDADYEEEEEPIKLKGWQLRRLAYALKVGRRKTSIKNLAAELCLDRAVVLEMLREPPPSLLMMSASLPDKPKPPIKVTNSEDTPSVPSEEIADPVKPDTKAETPVHVLQGSWSAQKRLKKVQVGTLENVYRRTKRPTNAMISSIVHVTNLPRMRVVKWFEDKRAADGVPEEHRPYRRSTSETVFAK